MKYVKYQYIKRYFELGSMVLLRMYIYLNNALLSYLCIIYRNSEEFRYLESPNERRKRHTVDSGYSTTDSNEKSRWSPSEVS